MPVHDETANLGLGAQVAILRDEMQDVQHTLYNNGLNLTVQEIRSNQSWVMKIGGWILGIVATILAGMIVAGVAWVANH